MEGTTDTDYAVLEREYEELITKTLKLQKNTHKMQQKEQQVGEDIGELKLLLAAVLEASVKEESQPLGSLMTETDEKLTEKPLVSNTVAEHITLLFDRTDEMSSLERPFRPMIVQYATSASTTATAASGQK